MTTTWLLQRKDLCDEVLIDINENEPTKGLIVDTSTDETVSTISSSKKPNLLLQNMGSYKIPDSKLNSKVLAKQEKVKEVKSFYL